MVFHSFIHASTYGVSQVPGSNVSIQVTTVPFRASLASPEIFIAEAMSAADKWEGFTVFPLTAFPTCSGLDDGFF